MSMAKQDLKDRMKQGLGGSINPKQSIYDATVPIASPPKVQPIEPRVAAAVSEGKKQTKADLFTQRVTLVISREQRDRIESLAKDIQGNGQKKPERITANTVVRCLVDLLEEFDADTSLIKNEEDLRETFKIHFNPKAR